MAKHLFLTGEKGVGKTTLLQQILSHYTGNLGGFSTCRRKDFLPNKWTVHLFSAAEAPLPTKENLLFVCGQPGADTAARFDRLGCTALEKPADLILLDELGPHEAEAVAFRRAVLEKLDGPVPILGVLQAPAADFWPEITAHKDVCLITVTAENRQALARQLTAQALFSHN